MRASILSTQAFGYAAEIRELGHPGSGYDFRITSTFAGAKDPAAVRTNLQITLDAAGLLALRDLIDAEVRS